MSEYIAIHSRGWGKGSYETEAVQNLVPHLKCDGSDESITLIEVEGFQGLDGFSVVADEILSETEITLKGDDLEELSQLLSDAEMKAEETLVNSEK